MFELFYETDFQNTAIKYSKRQLFRIINWKVRMLNGRERYSHENCRNSYISVAIFETNPSSANPIKLSNTLNSSVTTDKLSECVWAFVRLALKGLMFHFSSNLKNHYVDTYINLCSTAGVVTKYLKYCTWKWNFHFFFFFL